jgi:hypothetical protein
MKNVYDELDDKNDFGFSFTNEEEITDPIDSSKDEEINDLKSRLNALQKMFLPFLQHLAKDPSKPMIRWPNRKEVIDSQIDKLMKITNV